MRSAFADPELRELLRDDPELLAIADAVVATSPRARRIRSRSIVAAVVAAAAVAAAPALAFSPAVRDAVGWSKPSKPLVEATLTGSILKHPYPRPGRTVTVTWTMGEPGKRWDPDFPGLGVFVTVLGGREQGPWVSADGDHGRYSARIYVPDGGIKALWIGYRGTAHVVNPSLYVPITNTPY